MKIIKSKSMMFSFSFYLYCYSYFAKNMRNYTFINKNTNEVYKTSDKDIIEKGSAYLWLKDTTILIMKQLS